MKNYERPKTGSNPPEGVETAAFASHPGLEESLWASCDPQQTERRSLAVLEIAEILAKDVQARDAARQYLSPSGKGYQRSSQYALEMQDAISRLITKTDER
jgi:hypothetical protein